MARRFSAPYLSEPVSGLATWARNLAVFSVIAVAVSIIIVRFGFLEVKPAIATFFGALGLAGLSILIGFLGFAAIRQNGRVAYDLTVFEVKRPDESKYPWDYYKPVRNVSAQDAFGPDGLGDCVLN